MSVNIGSVTVISSKAPCSLLLPSSLKNSLLSSCKAFVLAFLLVLLGACSSNRPADPDPNMNPNAGRYDMENDSPVLEPIDVNTIEHVVPRVERRTIAGNKSPYTINGRTYYIRDSEEGYVANGYASWYGRKFHGHETSNGEIYDMFRISAAHKTLPIPSYARVTNLDNGKSVIVRINDRGPFHDDRIIDLSYAAATLLDYADKGTARVRVEAVLPGDLSQGTVSQPAVLPSSTPPALTATPLPDPELGPVDFLQVGAFASVDSAHNLVAGLRQITSLPVVIHSENQNGNGSLLHRVRVGPLEAGIDIDGLIRQIQAANLGNPFRVSQ